ncbi:zinc ABC transporter substrate-binding protein [Nitrosopumilus sp. Nsub]|uniref:metal ABC transporter solute-binding protein, Zn/Mn family n=1 Tax=Nitrosopumilus sp. Nsub TaxID=1776294 RepID=UPI000831A7A1|nr:zinc ABC transporter substrate-binding protein [Nitrosopumilus sp. Nsub]
MKGSQIGIIGGGIAAAVIIAVFLVSQTGMSQDAATSPLPFGTDSQNETMTQPEDKLLVYTTFYPLYQFTQSVAGDAADVRILMPTNGDPHAFELGPKTIVELTKADVLIYNGIDFEPYIDEIMSSPDFDHVVFVDTSEGIELMEGEAHDHHGDGGHDEDKHDEHEEDGKIDHTYDPHIWLDPILAKSQVMTIADHLKESDPEHAEIYHDNAISYTNQLDQLDQEIQSEISSCTKDTFVPFHNAFSYFAERYDLKTLAVIQEFSPESPVTAKDIEELIHFAEDEDIKYFFTEENRNPKLSERLATELGGNILLFSTLESISENDDPNVTYFEKMRQNVDNLQIALECN